MTTTPTSEAQSMKKPADATTAEEVLDTLPQAALREQLLSLAQAVPGFLYTTRIDAEGNSTFPFASDGIEELIGLRPEEIRNNAALLRSRYHPDDRPGLMERIRESARTLSPFRYELRVFHSEHDMRWVDMRATPHRLPDGTIEAHGLMLDITERKIAEIEEKARHDEILELNERLEENACNLEENAVELEAAHEQLKMTEAWFRGILHSAPDGILVVNEGGVIMLVNAQLARLFGYAEGEMIGQRLEMLVPADVRGRHDHMRQAFVDSTAETWGSHGVSNLRGCRKDGSEFPIDVTLSRLPNTDFSEGTICASIRDISERSRLESELAAHEREYRTLADNLPAPVIRYDAEGRRRYLNPAAERMFRAEAPSLLGRPQDATAPASSRMLGLYRNAIAEVVATRTPRDAELVLDALPEEQQEHYSVRFVPDLGPDGAVGVLAIGFDITAIKRAERTLSEREAFLESILDAMPIPVFFKNRQGRFLGCNPACESLLGRPREQIRGKTVFDIAPRKLAEKYHASDEALYASDGGIQQYEAQVENAQGEIRDAMFHKATFADADGKPAGLIGAILDITERKAAEVEAGIRYKEIAQLNLHLEENTRNLEEQAVKLETAHEQIKNTEAWYRGVIQSAPDGMLVIDQRGTITLVNERLARMFGYAESELIGRPMEMLVPPDARGGHAAMRAGFVETVMTERKAYGVPNLRGWRKDGSEFDADISLSRLPEADFRDASICASVRDITELKRAENRLRRALDFNQGVIDAMPDILFEVNREGRYLNVWTGNPDVLAAQKVALLGKTVHDVLPPESAVTALEAIRDAEAHGVSYGNILRVPRPEGDRWYEHSLSRKPGATPSNVSFIVLSRDITERKQAEQHIEEARARLQSVLQTIPDLVWMKDVEGIYVSCNHAFERFFGATEVEIVGKTDFDFVDAELAKFFRTKDREAIDACRVSVNEEWVTFADTGRLTLLETRKVPVVGPDGKVRGILGVARDVTERNRMEEALAAREREFRTLVENSPDTVVRYGRDFRRLYVNPAMEQLFAADPVELIGGKPSEISTDVACVEVEKKLAEVFAHGLAVEFEWTWKTFGNKTICHLISMTPEFDDSGEVQSVLAVGRDISELNAFRQKIHQMAFYDTLTSLPNRALFGDRLRQMITDASWHGQSAGVMIIDLDRFKAVNDTMGHTVGDELLRETATRLGACVRSYDTVARLGGDEFAVLLPEIRAGADLGRIANKMLAMFNERFLLDGKEVFLSCSIGISLYPNDSTSAEDLVKYADSAMYFAKRSGRNGFRFYSKDLTSTANKRLSLESELRRAIERNELELYYQPKILLEGGVLIGSEALLRWKNKRLGMVPPDQFIQIAEDTGLIAEIGNWVLREACHTASEWNANGQPPHKVAINLSPRQFQSNDLVATIAAILNETACRPEWIELEITESLLLDEDGKVLDMLNSLRALGISIAIDDFGTGYSALSYLARFPIDTLKIDRSFINTVTTDNYRAELVRAILSIARCLRQQVVAEGVETVEQARFLTEHGCQIAQGYLYSKPLPKPEAAKFPKRLGDSGSDKG